MECFPNWIFFVCPSGEEPIENVWKKLGRWWIPSVTFSVEIRLLLPSMRDRNGTNFLLAREAILDVHHQRVANRGGLWFATKLMQKPVRSGKNAFRAVLCSAKNTSWPKSHYGSIHANLFRRHYFFFKKSLQSLLPLCLLLCSLFVFVTTLSMPIRLSILRLTTKSFRLATSDLRPQPPSWLHCEAVSLTLSQWQNGERLLTSGMAAGSAMVDMTSLMRSMGMSPTTLGLLFSSWGRGSEGLRFSPATTHTGRKCHNFVSFRASSNEFSQQSVLYFLIAYPFRTILCQTKETNPWKWQRIRCLNNSKHGRLLLAGVLVCFDRVKARMA